MKLLHAVCLAASALAALPASRVLAAEGQRGSPVNVGTGIANCVSPDWIAFAQADQSAVLDDADHRLVRSEMMRRYPVIRDDGFPSSRTILLQRQSGELLYIAVIDNPTRDGESCYNATFAAERFDLTLLLRRKYLAIEGSAR